MYWVSWRRLARSARTAALPISSSEAAERALARSRRPRLRAPPACADRRVWPSGMSRTPAEIRLAATACRKASNAGSSGNAVARGRDADRNRIGNRAAPYRAQPFERRTSQAACVASTKALSLRGGLEVPLFRRRQGRGELGDGPQCVIVRSRRPTIGVHEQHGIAEATALRDHHRKPAPQRLRRR